MHRNWLKNALFIGVSGLMLMTTAHAGMPVWTFAPVLLAQAAPVLPVLP